MSQPFRSLTMAARRSMCNIDRSSRSRCARFLSPNHLTPPFRELRLSGTPVMDPPTTPRYVVDYVRERTCAQGRLGARRPPTAPGRPLQQLPRARASGRSAEEGSRRWPRLASNCLCNCLWTKPDRELNFVIWSTLTCRRKELSLGASADCPFLTKYVDGCICLIELRKADLVVLCAESEKRTVPSV